MEVSAILRDASFSAQKGRLVANLIRRMPVGRALKILEFTPKKAAFVLKKLLESAIANAEHNKGANIDALKISTVYVDEAASKKRMSARAKGRGNRIVKRSCHITIEVSDGE